MSLYVMIVTIVGIAVVGGIVEKIVTSRGSKASTQEIESMQKQIALLNQKVEDLELKEASNQNNLLSMQEDLHFYKKLLDKST
jgi:TolA-binding protein